MLELEFLLEALKAADSTAANSMYFYQAMPMDKLNIFNESLKLNTYFAMQRKFNNVLDSEVLIRIKQLQDYIDARFQGKLYPVHDTHFHTTFPEFIRCPYTCLTEVIDCLSKIN